MNSGLNNPYQPPSLDPPEMKDAAWYLARVQRYYRWMALAMLAYVFVGAAAAIVSQIRDNSFRVVDALGPLVWCSLLIWLSVAMLRIASVKPDDFPKHYRTARWVGILAGSIFFPVLGIPALISVRRLTRYSQLTKNTTR